MSQYLHITAHHKAGNDKSICLAWWGTSIARSEDMTDAFPYTEDDRLVSFTDFGERVRTVSKAVDKKRQDINKLNNERQDLIALMQGCKESAAVDAMLERIDENEKTLDDAKNNYAEWQHILTTLEIILNIYEDNKDNWDIYYSNC